MPPAGRRGGLALLAAFAAYAAISVAAYLPVLPLDNSRTQLCTCGDTAQAVWFLGWVPYAIAHGHSLFYSNWVLYPAGVNLANNTAMTLLGMVAAPVTVLAGPVAAYNLVLRLAFALSALAMFALVRRLVAWWPAAFLAGLLYGFSPFMVGQGMSHEFLVFAPVPPLVLGIMLDVLGPRRWPARRAGLVLGLLFAAQFLIAAETFTLMALFAVLGAAVAMRYRQARDGLAHLGRVAAWAGAVCAAVIAYPACVFLAGPQHIVGSPHPLGYLYSWHSDLLGPLFPTPLMLFAPASLLRVGAALVRHNLQENGTYLGLPLVMATACLVAAFRRQAVIAVTGILALVSYLLSLGPEIDVAGHPTGAPGPFALLSHLPVLQDIEPVRLSLFTVLFVAVVLGTGLDKLRWLASRRGDPRWAAVTVAAGLVALLPLVPRWPYQAGPDVTPRFFSSAALSTLVPPGTVVAAFPYPKLEYNQAMVWQAQSGMRFRLLGGSAFFVPGPGGQAVNSSRATLHPLGIEAVFHDAPGQPPPRGAALPPRPGLVAAIRADLRRYHVGAVIIDPRVDPVAEIGFSYPLAGSRLSLESSRSARYAIRYLTAATGRAPVQVGGVIGWFHLARPPA